jgi:hypothetical protein
VTPRAGLPIFDANGKAMGGIQLTQFKHPLAFFLARNGGSPFCVISGHHRFYTDAELEALYPTRSAFFRNVIETTRYNLRQGYILKPEALRTVAEAFAAFTGPRHTGRP